MRIKNLGLVVLLGCLCVPGVGLSAAKGNKKSSSTPSNDEGGTPFLIVQVQEVLKGSVEGQRKAKRLQDQVGVRKKILQAKRDDLEVLKKEYDKSSPLMNAKTRAKKQQELQDKYLKFREEAQKNDQELKKLQGDLMAPLLQKIRDEVTKLANREGAYMALAKDMPGLLYIDPDSSRDITYEVTLALNKTYRKSQKRKKGLRKKGKKKRNKKRSRK